MSDRETEHLRVLIANERKDRLALVAPIVVALGHEVIAREIDVEDVGPVTARERPDVALVGLGSSSEHALGLIEKIVKEAACPVIVLLHAPDPDFVKEASKRGVFAHISDADVEDWQSSIDIVLRRFAEYHELEGAFGRRALTERAKGILMERHSIDEASAFEMLRDHSRASNRKLIDLAAAVVDGHRLLPRQPQAPPRPDANSGQRENEAPVWIGVRREQLSLSVVGTSRKRDKRRLPIHPEHLGRIDERVVELEQVDGPGASRRAAAPYADRSLRPVHPLVASRAWALPVGRSDVTVPAAPSDEVGPSSRARGGSRARC